MISRRKLLQSIGLMGAIPLIGAPKLSWANDKHIVIVGGGTAGVIAARYLKLLTPSLKITLIEKNEKYKPAFVSNTILSGLVQPEKYSFSYTALSTMGIEVMHDTVTEIDPVKNTIKLTSKSITYDRLIMATGISLDNSEIPGLKADKNHAWLAGSNIDSLKSQIQSIQNGGNILVSVPQGDYSGPWAAYERVSQIANYCKNTAKKAKITLLMGNKKPAYMPLFENAWQTLYPDMIDVLFEHKVTELNAKSAVTNKGSIKADALNIVPPNNANVIAAKHGLTDDTNWCPVQLGTFKSQKFENIYVIGDAISAKTGLSKTAQSANSQAKLCAIGIANEIAGKSAFLDLPPIIDSEYCILGKNTAVSRTSIFRIDKQGKMSVASNGISSVDAPDKQRIREAQYAMSWYNNITAEMFG